MNDLDKKYLDDELTPDELVAYKLQVNTESVSEQEKMIRQLWESGGFPASDCSAGLERIKNNIDSTISGRRRLPGARTILQYFSAAAVVALAICTALLYSGRQSVGNNSISVVTYSGEKSNVTLPDGTEVSMNENSSLSYKVKDFTRRSRRIEFMGEGYFDVAKLPGRSFVIDSQDAEVEVTGTRFLFLDRHEFRQMELILDEGTVNLTATETDRRVAMKVGEKAALDFDTGELSVKHSQAPGADIFGRTTLAFTNATFENVLNELSDTYHVSITTTSAEEDNFTGYLPATNFTLALDILSRLYGMKVTTSGNGYVLKAEQ